MTADLPVPESEHSLATLLSQALVAFTIEFDNEAEHRMPHRTSSYGSTPGALHAPWLVSLAMWANCMQFVGDAGVSVRELERLARTPTNLAGMERWGYVTVVPDPADRRAKPPRSDWLIRVTPAGRMAQTIWRPLFADIEQRWRERFGGGEIDALRGALGALANQFEADLPDCLPILGYGLVAKAPAGKRRARGERGDVSDLPLSALLSRVLLAFTLDFERESEAEVSLAICANVLRLVGEQGVRVGDLPRLAAVSKESIAMALGFLEKRGYASAEAEAPGSRLKLLTLSAKGRRAQETYRRLIGEIEARWRVRFGAEAIDRLCDSLERLGGESALARGLEPYPDGWRAAARRPEGGRLPHYPMVLHRGGFPDGS